MRHWLGLPVLALMTGIGALSLDMYLPSFPAIATDFAVTEGEVQITLSTFLIGFAIGQALYGPLSDALGRRPVVFATLAAYAIASAWCALANDVDQLAGIRVVQGIAGAAGSVLGRAIIRDLYSGPELARAMSTLILVVTAAPMSAPLIGAVVQDVFGWRAVFWALAVFAVSWIGLILLLIPETHPKEKRLTLRPKSIISAYGQVLRSKESMGYTLAASFGFGGMFTSIAATPFLFVNVYGVSPTEFALLFALNVVGMTLAAAVNRRYAPRYGTYAAMKMVTWLMVGSSAVLLVNGLTGFAGLVGLVVPLFVFVGCLSAAAANGLSGMMGPFGAIAGSASSVFGVFQFGAGAVFGAVVSWFHDGSAVPMVVLITVSAALAFVFFRLLVAEPPLAVDPTSVQAEGY